MPRPLLALAAGFALGCAAALAGVAPAAAATAQVTIDVPAGKVKSVRLRHLPRGTQVGFVIIANGKLGVALVGGKQLKGGKASALFRAAFSRRLSFKIAIPASDDYYLVLDNRRGAATVRVTATVEAEAGKKKAPAAPKREEKLDQTRAAGAARA